MIAFFIFTDIYYYDNKKYTYMKKKLIRLTESDLHRIIKESVNVVTKNVVNETKNGTTYEELERVHNILSDIMNSDFIPFSSPSPSSTEKGIADAIIEAARNIDKAMYLCGQCGYNQPIAHLV